MDGSGWFATVRPALLARKSGRSVSCLISVPDLRLGGLLGRREDVACRRRTRNVLRTLDSEVHPSCVHGLKHFFGRSGVALRDAELLERFRPPCTRDCKGFHVELQDFTQLLRDLIRADHRTKLDDAMPWPGWPGQKGCDLRADVVRRDHGRFPVCRIIVDR